MVPLKIGGVRGDLPERDEQERGVEVVGEEEEMS